MTDWAPSARIVLDSTAYGHRLITAELTIHPRAVEHLLTHRSLSRSGASRRAIPLWKQVESVEALDVFPAKWGAERPGMQSGDEVEDILACRRAWRMGKHHAIATARVLGSLGVHKEVASAPLHPYMERTYLVSATEWDNFFRLRLHPDAQEDIRLAAQMLDQEIQNSTPVKVGPGEWHLPYIEDEDREQCAAHGIDLRLVSAMRCARVSYLNHGGGRDVFEDEVKGAALAGKGHWGALEHQATPVNPYAPTANFRGWQQLRTQMGA